MNARQLMIRHHKEIRRANGMFADAQFYVHCPDCNPRDLIEQCVMCEDACHIAEVYRDMSNEKLS